MKVFFDTTAWIDIIHDEITARERQFLQQAVNSETCSIYISPEVFEELLPEKQYDPNRFGKQAPFICDCVRGDLLLPYNLRMAFEILYGHALEVHESLIPSLGTGGLLQFITEDDHADVVQKTVAAKTSMKHTTAEGYSKSRDFIKQSVNPSEHEGYIKEKRRRIGEEAAEYFHAFWSKKIHEQSCRSLPTNWSFFAFEIARQTLALAPEVGKKRARSLDGTTYDQIVFSDSFGLGCDLLVSSDTVLAEIVEVIAEVDDRTPKVVGLQEFLRQLESHTS